jgi:hypothetical protein
MGEAQGKKVSPPPLRHRRSRRRRPLARSSHQRPGGSRRSDSTEEKTWRKSSNPHKRPPSWGEGKETLAYRRRHCMSGPRPHSARMADRVASTETPPQCDRALQRPRCGHALVAISVNNHPRNDERRGLSLDWPATSADEAVSRRRQCLVRRRARGREHHARPSRGCHDDRACNCHGLSPTVGRYADVRQAERGMISRDGGRHYKEEPDRTQRREGDLPGNKGDATGDRADDDRRDRSRTAVIGGKPCAGASELCGVPRYVAHAQQAFLWSTEAGFLRHIFWRG